MFRSFVLSGLLAAHLTSSVLSQGFSTTRVDTIETSTSTSCDVSGDYYWDTTDCTFCVCECSNSGSGTSTSCSYNCYDWSSSDAEDYLSQECQFSTTCSKVVVTDSTQCSCDYVECKMSSYSSTSATYGDPSSTEASTSGTSNGRTDSKTDTTGSTTNNGRTEPSSTMVDETSDRMTSTEASTSDGTTDGTTGGTTDKTTDSDGTTGGTTDGTTGGTTDGTTGGDSDGTTGTTDKTTDKTTDGTDGTTDGTTDRTTDKTTDKTTDGTTDDGTTDRTTDDYDTSDADEDEFLNDDSTETVDADDESSPYLYAEVKVSVTKVWYSRSDVWAILKRALHYMLEDSSDYDADGSRRYIVKWDAYRTDDDTTDSDNDDTTSSTNDDDGTTSGSTGSTGNDDDEDEPTSTAAATDASNSGRRMMLQTDGSDGTTGSTDKTTNSDGTTDATDGSTDGTTDGTTSGRTDGTTDGSDGSDVSTSDGSGSTSDDLDDRCDEESITFHAGLAVYDGDIDVIEKLYDFLIDLATAFGTDYALNCENEAITYRTCGWGTVDVLYAYIAYFDENGDTVDSAEYQGTGSTSGTGPVANESGAQSVHANVAVYVGLVAMFASVWMML